MNFEETFDELVIRKLADIEDVPTWNDTVIAEFKDWKSHEEEDLRPETTTCRQRNQVRSSECSL